ncbi:Bicyclomycin resistance protein [Aquicella siphonis]|uniref:Bcr/CflA family efflux transporter n=1 Tax=Aquicella siphonis TaxID=254247 RepID=A0A5E4PLA9_9COXI|nr:Bcr/CflA family efflux MFS transporter [Aquicella siphonis]VVC77201.1 Bicyclomycin resistance protein [Aquicella siphonis]
MSATGGAELDARKHIITFIALIGMLISGLSVDIYAPSLPAVTQYFNVDKGLVQFSITTYMIGFGLAQLFAGSFSDSLGRKNPLIIAICLFSLISFLIPYSQSIYQLQLLRLLQGVAVACVNVPTRAIIADLYEGPEFYKMMNYATIAWAIGPIIAPAIGGYLQHYIGWYASFYFLGGYGVSLLLLNLFFLPETIKNRRPFNGRELLYWYWTLLHDRSYLLGIVCLGLLYAMLILFGVVAPFLIQNVLNYSAVHFGYMALLIGLAWFFGNITNRFMIHIRIEKKVKISLMIMLMVTLVMLSFALKDTISIYDIILPTIFLYFLGGLVFPNLFAQNIAIFQHIAGYANGLMGSSVVLIAGVGSAVGIMLKSHSQVPLTLAYLSITMICLLCSFLVTYRELATIKSSIVVE